MHIPTESLASVSVFCGLICPSGQLVTSSFVLIFVAFLVVIVLQDYLRGNNGKHLESFLQSKLRQRTLKFSGRTILVRLHALKTSHRPLSSRDTW